MFARLTSRRVLGAVFPVAPLARLRAIALLMAVLSAAMLVPAAAGSTAPVALRALALAGLVALTGYWVWGYRRGGFPLAGEAAEVVPLVLAGSLVDPKVLMLPLLALIFRSLYGGGAAAAMRVVLYAIALEAIAEMGGMLYHDAVVERNFGHLIVGLIGQSLLRTLQREQVGEDMLRLYGAVKGHGVYTIDTDGLIVTWDTGMERMAGRTRDEVIGRHASIVFDEDAGPALDRELDAASWAGTLEHRGWRTAAGGLRFFAEIDTTALRDDRGTIHGFARLVHDVTDRHLADEALRESRERLRAAVQSSPIALWALDADGVCTLYESGMPAVADGGLVGRRADEVLTDQPYLLTATREALAGQARACTAVFGRRVTECRLIPLRDEAGAARGIVGIAMDVTERAMAETEAAQLQQQLVQSQRLETVGRLAGGVAHDFNNLLSVILSYAEFIGESLPEGDDLVEDVAEIQKAAQRGAALTRQLLVFSRRHVDKLELLDLNDVLDDMKKLLDRALGEELRLETDFEQPLWGIEADPSRVEQVLMNLVVNARDATPAGGVITIETANVEVDGAPHVRLCVRDTGAGMPPEVAQRAFEPFFTTKVGSGTGLGLAVVYAVVEQAGGRIAIASEEGGGTAVEVHLPATAVAEPECDERRERAPREGAGELVLVVEDEPAVAQSAVRTLQRGGYQTIVTTDPTAALTIAAETGRIDLVLSDVVMPDLRGPELVAQLREEQPDLRALFMSGYIGEEVAEDATQPLISKPFTSAALLERVGELLEAKAREAA